MHLVEALRSAHLTWRQRLKICLDAAKGLSYLHDPRETHRRLIHCDIKSANILLDDQWKAKVSDLGLSIIGSANEEHSVIVTLAAGTHGYCDPEYAMTHTLTKESDVYSFGVVLFEVLCGTLCCTYSNGRVEQNLVRTWIGSYEENKLNDIILKDPNIQPLEQSALEIFSDIAYQCLKESRADRPKMAEVVAELESALESQELLESQEFIEWKGKLFFYEELSKTTESPLNYRSEVEFMKLLYKVVLLNGGKTWFSLNKKGEHCEMISIAECLGSEVLSSRFSSKYNSRFTAGTYEYFFKNEVWKADVKTQFLSPGITYTVNLVFTFRHPVIEGRCSCIGLNYRLKGETENSISHLAYVRDDGWWMCELYQLTTDHTTVDLQILFHSSSFFSPLMEIEGIEFRPLEKVEHKDENQPISDVDSDTNWEEKMPTDYEGLIKRSENSLQWTTKEEAYSIIRKGLFFSDDNKKRRIWFSLDKNGKKCHMLSAVLWWSYQATSGKKMFCLESRFEEVVHWDSDSFLITTKLQPRLVSTGTAYAIYLVYKLPNDQSGFEAPMEVSGIKRKSGNIIWYNHLTCPQTPVIRPKAGQNTHSPLNKPKFKGLPQQRNDGWMEVQIWEWGTATTTYKDLMLRLWLRLCDRAKFGELIIEGIEFRPM
ncbi:putative protein kinase RLK-Pelle-CrRLK1L-1 family [Helianthus debilis subsp. tardiflorus]